jgi:hypothetical protein
MRYWQTWKEVIADPFGFFNKVPKEKWYKKPTLFFLKTTALSLLLNILFMLLFTSSELLNDPSFQSLFASIGSGILTLIIIALFPFIILFSWGMLFLVVGLIHLFIKLVGGKSDYNATFKLTCYSYAPSLLSFVPVLGIIAYIYSVVLQVIGTHKLHNITLGKSALAILLPIIILMLFGFGLAALAFTSILPTP